MKFIKYRLYALLALSLNSLCTDASGRGTRDEAAPRIGASSSHLESHITSVKRPSTTNEQTPPQSLNAYPAVTEAHPALKSNSRGHSYPSSTTLSSLQKKVGSSYFGQKVIKFINKPTEFSASYDGAKSPTRTAARYTTTKAHSTVEANTQHVAPDYTQLRSSISVSPHTSFIQERKDLEKKLAVDKKAHDKAVENLEEKQRKLASARWRQENQEKRIAEQNDFRYTGPRMEDRGIYDARRNIKESIEIANQEVTQAEQQLSKVKKTLDESTRNLATHKEKNNTDALPQTTEEKLSATQVKLQIAERNLQMQKENLERMQKNLTNPPDIHPKAYKEAYESSADVKPQEKQIYWQKKAIKAEENVANAHSELNKAQAEHDATVKAMSADSGSSLSASPKEPSNQPAPPKKSLQETFLGLEIEEITPIPKVYRKQYEDQQRADEQRYTDQISLLKKLENNPTPEDKEAYNRLKNPGRYIKDDLKKAGLVEDEPTSIIPQHLQAEYKASQKAQYGAQINEIERREKRLGLTSENNQQTTPTSQETPSANNAR